MVLHCVAYGCNNLQDPRKKIPYHKFPFNRPQILELWIKAVRRENWYPSKTSRLCGEHFTKSDYQNKPGSTMKLLKPDSVPSIFCFSKPIKKRVKRPALKEAPHNEENLNRSILQEIHAISNEPTTSSSQQSKQFQDAGVQTNLSAPGKSNYVLRKKIKSLKQKIRRRDLKIGSMKEVIDELSRNGLSSEDLDAVLKKHFQGFPLELVMHQHKNESKSHAGQRRYSEIMKQFALTLQFYSPKAYNFLRKHFLLPNGRTIRKWLTTVNCGVGFLKEVLDFLKLEVERQPHLKHVALIFDAMAIRKQIIWDNQAGKFVGNVDYGGLVHADDEKAASEALFFQIVSYTRNFKCPVGYFLTDKSNADIQAQLIRCCLRNLFECGIIVRSITCDGTSTNVTTYQKLGCVISADNIVPYFQHPCVPIKVYCILDTCHMLKLARNACAEKMLCSDKGIISWEYLRLLDQVQESEQLRLANSLTSNHIYFKNKIMNVRLAAQSLSSGVADALDFFKNSGEPGFEGSGPTIEFIRKIDKLFDILNCRNPFGKGFKAPMRPTTLNYFKDIFDDTNDYLKTLRIDGIPLIHHSRKTFAIGFMLTMKSTLGLVQDLFCLQENPLDYFLSYKTSQDHLELYFSCIRSKGGWNNNPNCLQLKWSLRRLLFKNSVTASVNANCLTFDEYCTPAFEFRSQERSAVDFQENEGLEDLLEMVNYIELTDYQENVLYYISGYIVRNLVKTTSCSDCCNILLFKNESCVKNTSEHAYCASSESFKKFTNAVTRGSLLYASDIVYKIVHFVERQFRSIVLNEKNNILIKARIYNLTMQYFGRKLELFLPKHPICEEFLCEELHELQLIRKIINLFLKCRMHHHAKLLNLKLHGKDASIRQKMTKLILFKNC